MAKASIAAGAHGLMIEVHDRPDEALSDGAQAIDPAELSKIIEVCNRLYRTLSSEIN